MTFADNILNHVQQIKKDFDAIAEDGMTGSQLCEALGIENRWGDFVTHKYAVNVYHDYLLNRLQNG